MTIIAHITLLNLGVIKEPERFSNLDDETYSCYIAVPNDLAHKSSIRWKQVVVIQLQHWGAVL